MFWHYWRTLSLSVKIHRDDGQPCPGKITGVHENKLQIKCMEKTGGAFKWSKREDKIFYSIEIAVKHWIPLLWLETDGTLIFLIYMNSLWVIPGKFIQILSGRLFDFSLILITVLLSMNLINPENFSLKGPTKRNLGPIQSFDRLLKFWICSFFWA